MVRNEELLEILEHQEKILVSMNGLLNRITNILEGMIKLLSKM